MAAKRGTGNVRGRAYENTEHRYVTTYIDGNVVRNIEAVPAYKQRPNRDLSNETLRNREKALHMSLPYVMFLTVAAVATVFLCVQYLQLQAQGTQYRNQVAVLESRLSSARAANDNEYEKALSSVNMEQIKDIAVHELGMVYAGEGQIIYYSSQNRDYIRQYTEIPEG